MVEWRTPMRSARSRFDDHLELDTPFQWFAGFVNMFLWLAFIGCVGLAGWAVVFAVAYLVHAVVLAVVR